MTYQAGGKKITGALSGTETVVVGNGGPQITTVTTQQIADLAGGGAADPVITALNTVGAGTITAAGIIGKITARGGAQSNTAFTDTTDTAAAIIAALPPGSPIGSSFIYTYENTTDANATIQGGVGVTVSGITSVKGKSQVMFLVTYSAAGAVTVAGFFQTAPNAVSGTFTANGASAVTVADTRVTASSSIIVTLKTVGGTVGAIPAIKTITAGTGFTIAGTASDTSDYNYLIIN